MDMSMLHTSNRISSLPLHFSPPTYSLFTLVPHTAQTTHTTFFANNFCRRRTISLPRLRTLRGNIHTVGCSVPGYALLAFVAHNYYNFYADVNPPSRSPVRSPAASNPRFAVRETAERRFTTRRGHLPAPWRSASPSRRTCASMVFCQVPPRLPPWDAQFAAEQ